MPLSEQAHCKGNNNRASHLAPRTVVIFPEADTFKEEDFNIFYHFSSLEDQGASRDSCILPLTLWQPA